MQKTIDKIVDLFFSGKNDSKLRASVLYKEELFDKEKRWSRRVRVYWTGNTGRSPRVRLERL